MQKLLITKWYNFSERGASPVYRKCSHHSGKACELHCNTPVRRLCVTESHQGHTLSSNIKKTYTAQKEKM